MKSWASSRMRIYCEIANRRLDYWRMASQNYDGFYLRDHRAEMMR